MTFSQTPTGRRISPSCRRFLEMTMTAPDPSIEVMRLINGYQVSQALHVVATLGVAIN